MGWKILLAWDRQLVAEKFKGAPQRKALGRPTTDAEDDPERARCDHGGLGLFALRAVVDPGQRWKILSGIPKEVERLNGHRG